MIIPAGCRDRSRASIASLRQRIAGRMFDLAADTRGSVAIVAAIIFPIVIGGMGLGAETGYWYLSQRKLQHATDVAAHAGAVRLRAGDTTLKIRAAAENIARASGLSSTVGTIQVNSPPLTGAKSGSAASVEVILAEVQPRLFSSVFSSKSITISTRAVATYSASSAACVLALSPTASGAINVTGSTSVSLAGCDIASNSNASDSFLMSANGSSLTAGCVEAVGGTVTTSNLVLTQCPSAKSFAPVVRDPYASVVEPSAIGVCQSDKSKANTSTTLTPTDTQPNGVKSMRFCSGFDAKGIVTFSPGLYIIENGGLTVNGNVQLIGSGVTFYFVNGGKANLGSNALVNLSAPTSGPYSGLLFFGSRTTAGGSQTITGTSGSSFQGALYMPGSGVAFTGNSAISAGCTQIIGRTVTFAGNSSLKSSCSSAGTKTISASEAVTITE